MAYQKIFATRVRRQAARLRSELRKVTLVNRIEEIGEQLVEGFAQQVANLIDPLPIVTKGDLARVDRRISQLTRRLRKLEKPSTG